MKLNRIAGSTSEIWHVFIQDSSSTTGAGLTGLAFNTSGLTAYYHRDTDTTATAITLATMTVGTFTSSGFKEVDATNMPGWYQFCPPNAALASGAKSCGFHLKGAANMAPLPIEVDMAGTITSAASVTGDLSATAKTSVQTAADAAITANATIIEIEAETDGIAAIPTSNPTAAAIATAVWQDTTAGDFAVSGSVGKGLFLAGAPGLSGGLPILGLASSWVYSVDVKSVNNFTCSGVTSIKPVWGLTTADTVSLTAAERSKLTGFTTTVQVGNTGNATTDGATLKAAILAAGAGTLIKVDPGRYVVDVGAGLTFPASVVLRGSGRKSTIIEYGNGGLQGIHPGTDSMFEDLTLYVTFDDYAFSIHGSTQVTNFSCRNVDIISDNLECVDIQTSAVCSLRFENVYFQSQFEWAITATGAAHTIVLDRVTTYVVANGSTTDAKAVHIDNGTTLIATNCNFMASETSSTGQVIRVQGSSSAFLSNCTCFDGDINILAAGGYILMTDCQFNRSKITGFSARLVDVMTGTVAAVGSGGITAASLASGTITAAKFGSGAIDSTALNATAAAKIADTTARRTRAHIEASSDGDTIGGDCLYGAMSEILTSDTSTHAGKLTVFKSDGTTELVQKTVTTDVAALPVVKVQ